MTSGLWKELMYIKQKELNQLEHKITAILEKEVPSLVEMGYQVARERDLKTIGKQLAECTGSLAI